jgi:hypothetical protein
LTLDGGGGRSSVLRHLQLDARDYNARLRDFIDSGDILRETAWSSKTGGDATKAFSRQWRRSHFFDQSA